MAYVMSTDYSPVSDLGVAPCPPPEGCPPGTRVNPSYPAHSSTCCKPIAGTARQPATPGITGQSTLPERTSLAPSLPEGMMTGAGTGPAAPPEEAWFQKYRWYILGGAVLATGGTIAYTMLKKKKTAATSACCF